MDSVRNKAYFLFIIGLIIVMCTELVFSDLNDKREIRAMEACVDKAVSEISEKIDNAASEISATVTENIPKANTSDIDEDTVPVDNDTDFMSDTTCRFTIGEEVDLPLLSTEPKHFTDYRSYNLPYTPHYRLQQLAYTDEDGLRRFNQDYIVALGKFYSESIGDRFQITLDTGVEFTVILGDGKNPIDCDDTNMYAPCVNYDGEKCANVLEFIVDTDVLSSDVYGYGSINCIDKFKGNIVKMVYLGRDNSADWDVYQII